MSLEVPSRYFLPSTSMRVETLRPVENTGENRNRCGSLSTAGRSSRTRNLRRMPSIYARARIVVADRDQTRRRAGQARRRHPQAEEQVRPVLRRHPEVSADARAASARGLHLRARKTEDARQRPPLPLLAAPHALQPASRVVGTQDAGAGGRSSRFPAPLGAFE